MWGGGDIKLGVNRVGVLGFLFFFFCGGCLLFGGIFLLLLLLLVYWSRSTHAGAFPFVICISVSSEKRNYRQHHAKCLSREDPPVALAEAQRRRRLNPRPADWPKKRLIFFPPWQTLGAQPNFLRETLS